MCVLSTLAALGLSSAGNAWTFVSDSFFGCLPAGGCIGPDIRRRSSRPIAGKDACAPSRDRIGLVLEQGEDRIFFVFSYELASASPEGRSTSVCVRARGARPRRKVTLDQGIHPGRSLHCSHLGSNFTYSLVSGVSKITDAHCLFSYHPCSLSRRSHPSRITCRVFIA